MNPAVNPHLVVSCMIGEEAYRDVDASAVVGPEIYHDFNHSLDHKVHSASLEDAVRPDNHLAERCSQFELSRAQFPKSVISLAGVEHMILLGKDGKGVFAVPAFNEPVYLGETLEEVRESLSALRTATTFKQRGYLA